MKQPQTEQTAQDRTGMSKEQRAEALGEASAVPDTEVGRNATAEEAPKSAARTGTMDPREAGRPAAPSEEDRPGMTGEDRAEALAEASAVPDAEPGRESDGENIPTSPS